MLRRFCILALGLAALTVAVSLHAGEPRQKGQKDLTDKDLRDIAAKERILQERYKKFEEALQGLHDRLANGTAADKERAAKLKGALDKSLEGSVSERFERLAKVLSGSVKDKELAKLVKDSQDLARDLQDVLDLLEGGGKKLVNHKDKILTLRRKLNNSTS